MTSALRWTGCCAAVKTQYRLMLLPSLLPTLVFCLLSPLVFSIRNLDAPSASIVLERFFALFGILLLTPVPLPEQDRAVREVVASRAAPYVGVTGLRFALLLPALPLAVCGLCAAMVLGGSVFPCGAFLYGGVVTAFALGTLGFFAFCLTDNWVAGYLAPACYFTLNMGLGQRLGNYYLFSLGLGSLREKHWLLASGLLLAALALLFLLVKQKNRGV